MSGGVIVWRWGNKCECVLLKVPCLLKNLTKRLAPPTHTPLSHGGTIVTYGGLARKPVTLGAGALIFRDVRATGFWLSSPSRVARRRPDMDTVARLLQEGVIGTE